MGEFKFEEFRDICLMHGVLCADSVIKSIYKDVMVALKMADSRNPAKDILAAYCMAFKERYKSNPVITGKDQGIAKRLAKDVGVERTIALIHVYMSMDEKYFLTRRHDLATFSVSLNAVQVKHQTGKGMTQIEASQIEQVDANKTVMRRYLEKRGNER